MEKTEKQDFSGFFSNSGDSQKLLKQDLNLKKWSFSNATDLSELESEEMTVEPSDPTKPAVYTDPGGKKYILINAKITKKKENRKNKINSGNSGNSELKLKIDNKKREAQETKVLTSVKTSAKIASAKKNTDRKQFSTWNLLWLLLLLIPVLAWRVYKKIRKVNPIS
ncbi:hypothetical protein GJU43_14890 [Flavobacterium sp. LC2016-23]|uniref:hypothetical protein n=1 Tax=Flavobacterium sp. LC2016-23 TaxID=2666330 RepID=UPI0012B1061F|nr:hypothetical protein [Flavobacterium sp. LC2016-23]MRX40573.1 hypothetical protein [Flavobacterium sp. LC2016-23]